MALQMKKASGGTGLAICARSRVIGFIGQTTLSVIETTCSDKRRVQA
jgi:hypothetical protein